VDQLLPLLFLLAVAAAFWLLVIRPARNRQQEQLNVVRTLEPGARVLMASGMVGTVKSLGDDDLEVEIAPGVVATFVKQAVLRTVPDPADAPTTDSGAAAPEQPTADGA
jgi:preprotein translocase subunit YajC